MHTSPTLIATERRLILTFVGGAFLFLIIFESIFLVSRIVIEKEFTEEAFMEGMVRIERRGNMHGNTDSGTTETRGLPRPPIGLGYLNIEQDGTISGGQFGPEIPVEEIGKSIDTGFLGSLTPNALTYKDGLIYYKKIIDSDGRARVFIRQSGYPISDILRDIFRFLALDILILIPFYFMGRYYVRETLAPVAKNIDTMSHFIHDAGHELKTPLAIISGNLQLLRDSKTPDPTLLDESVGHILSVSESLDGLLDLVSIQRSTEKTSIPLLENIEEIIHTQRKNLDEKHIHIHVDIPKGAKVSLPPHHFRILFSNLLQNAIKYNKDGGKISVEYRKNTLSISDTGIGIDEKDIEKIFERFYRADRSGKYSGTGIGLSMVARIGDVYGWKSSVKSTKGEGTTFFLETK